MGETKNNTHIRRVIAFSATLFAVVLAAMPAAVQGQAIYTTLFDGTAVNQNIYPSKTSVYLNGGPQNQNANGLLDGYYYFMVTDPSGSQLLSTDDILNRALTVANGVVSGVAGSGGTHAVGLFNPNNLSTPVQLIPFHNTPNQGGEYKVWLTPVGAYNPNAPSSVFGFIRNESMTDNFKVAPGTDPVTAPVPEPATMVLSGLGIAAVLRRRRGARA